MYPKFDLSLKTRPMLSVSMTVVLKPQQEHWKCNAKFSLSKHRFMDNVMKFLSPFLKGFLQLYPVMDIMRRLSSGMIYPLNYVFKHIFLSIVLFSLIITFSFPLFGLNLLEVYMI